MSNQLSRIETTLGEVLRRLKLIEATLTPSVEATTGREPVIVAEIEAVALQYDKEWRGGIGRGDIDTELAERLAKWFNLRLAAFPNRGTDT